MTAIHDARAHLAKAKEFLEAASVSRDLEMFNAATSNAVISGINSKDAICLQLTGRTGKSETHTADVRELRSAEGDHGQTKQLSEHLRRLLTLKNKCQYQTAAVAAADATRAVDWAQKLLAGAQDIVG